MSLIPPQLLSIFIERPVTRDERFVTERQGSCDEMLDKNDRMGRMVRMLGRVEIALRAFFDKYGPFNNLDAGPNKRNSWYQLSFCRRR